MDLQTFKMAQASVSASIQAPSVDVMVDLGNPLLNRVVDGFIKVGGIGALHAAAQDSYRLTLQGTNCTFLYFTVQVWT